MSSLMPGPMVSWSLETTPSFCPDGVNIHIGPVHHGDGKLSFLGDFLRWSCWCVYFLFSPRRVTVTARCDSNTTLKLVNEEFV